METDFAIDIRRVPLLLPMIEGPDLEVEVADRGVNVYRRKESERRRVAYFDGNKFHVNDPLLKSEIAKAYVEVQRIRLTF